MAHRDFILIINYIILMIHYLQTLTKQHLKNYFPLIIGVHFIFLIYLYFKFEFFCNRNHYLIWIIVTLFKNFLVKFNFQL
jgi:hypothetical protein